MIIVVIPKGTMQWLLLRLLRLRLLDLAAARVCIVAVVDTAVAV
jgi:hypothetical protein